MRKQICWVEGIIGSGKTTLTMELAKLLNMRPILEPVTDNTALEAFYKDHKRWAFLQFVLDRLM